MKRGGSSQKKRGGKKRRREKKRREKRRRGRSEQCLNDMSYYFFLLYGSFFPSGHGYPGNLWLSGIVQYLQSPFGKYRACMCFLLSTGGRGFLWYSLQSLLTSPHVLHRRGSRVVLAFACISAGAETPAGASTATQDGVAAAAECPASIFSVAGGPATVPVSEPIGPE